MKRLLAAALALVLLTAVAVALEAFRFLQNAPSQSDVVEVFEIEPGHALKATARKLEEAHLITNADRFVFLARMTGQAGKVRVGEYAIRRNMRPTEVLGVITSGKSIEHVVTIQEGLNIYEIGSLLEREGIGDKQEFLKTVKDWALIRELLREELPSLEGYIFPETYHLTKFTGIKGFVRMAVERFLQNYQQVKAAPQIHLNRHETVILASIIEKETGAPEERPVISSVFHNRLRAGMRLQTDPTIVYGILAEGRPYNRNITRADIVTPTRYNTYTFTGLPYGPISNPGLAALKAAAQPAESDFLFFVSRNDGTHTFSKSYGDHQKAVGKYQLNQREREGKSWRDLKGRNEAAAAEHLNELKKPAVGGSEKRIKSAAKSHKADNDRK